MDGTKHAPEDGRIGLHGLLHVQPNLGSGEGTVRVPNLVQELDALHTSFVRNLLVWFAGSQVLLDVVGGGAAEDDDIQQRVGTETVSTVNRHTGSLSSSIKSRHDLFLAALC